MNFDTAAPQAACHILSANSSDVDKAFHNLKRDMNPEFVHVFLDKIQRYAAKPDRALFLAEYQENIIAFATIINHSPAPENSDKTTSKLLKNYACGTGLMVLPEFRHKGVASRLVQHWETWAGQNSLDGIWIVTRQMADWYQRCFHYSVQGTTFRHGVKKIILTKSLS
jgi:GNAT superfamily N-acetyltransferase